MPVRSGLLFRGSEVLISHSLERVFASEWAGAAELLFRGSEGSDAAELLFRGTPQTNGRRRLNLGDIVTFTG